MMLSPSKIAQRFIGEKEIAGDGDNPLIVWMLKRLAPAVRHDEVAWCAAFAAFIAFLCGVSIPHVTLAARSWLRDGRPVDLDAAVVPESAFVVVVLKRGEDPQPGPDVFDAPGHVGIYVTHNSAYVWIVGGNQSDAVSVERVPRSAVLGIREYDA